MQAFRSDKFVILADDTNFPPATLQIEDIKKHYAILHAEYVYDDAINPALNIWNGLRYKFYLDYNSKVNKTAGSTADNPYFPQFRWRWKIVYSYLSEFHLGIARSF
jgi:hypothetical protein